MNPVIVTIEGQLVHFEMHAHLGILIQREGHSQMMLSFADALARAEGQIEMPLVCQQLILPRNVPPPRRQ